MMDAARALHQMGALDEEGAGLSAHQGDTEHFIGKIGFVLHKNPFFMLCLFAGDIHSFSAGTAAFAAVSAVDGDVRVAALGEQSRELVLSVGTLNVVLGEAVELPVFTKNFEEFHPVGAPSANLDPDYDPFESSPVPSSPKSFPQASSQPSSYSRNIAPNFDFDHQAESRVNYGKLFEEKTLPTTQILIIQGKYIIVPARSGVMVVHVRRARERILYERFLRAVSANEHVVQTALFPVQVNIGAANKLIFDENAAMLSSLGFDISPFGNDTIVVNGVPEGYSCDASSVEKMIDDLLVVLSEQKHSLKETMASATAARFAALGAASAPAITSPFEAQKLIDRLLACDNAEFTSNGRRIISIESLEELEKKF